MKYKMEQKKNDKVENDDVKNPAFTEDQIISIFSTGEKVEKSLRGAKPNGKKKKAK